MTLTTMRFSQAADFTRGQSREAQGQFAYQTCPSFHPTSQVLGFGSSEGLLGSSGVADFQDRLPSQAQPALPPNQPYHAQQNEMQAWKYAEPKRVELQRPQFQLQPELLPHQFEDSVTQDTWSSQPFSRCGSLTPDSPEAGLLAYKYGPRSGSDTSSEVSFMHAPIAACDALGNACSEEATISVAAFRSVFTSEANSIARSEEFGQRVQICQDQPLRQTQAREILAPPGLEHQPVLSGLDAPTESSVSPRRPSYLPKFATKRSTSGTTASSRSQSSWPSPKPTESCSGLEFPLPTRTLVGFEDGQIAQGSPQFACPTGPAPWLEPTNLASNHKGVHGLPCFTEDTRGAMMGENAWSDCKQDQGEQEWDMTRAETHDPASVPSVPELSQEQLLAMAARKPSKSGMIGGIRIRLPQNGSPFSQGSLGHPTTCAEACPYVKRKSGCKLGAECDKCHLCFWQRPSVKAARQEQRRQRLANEFAAACPNLDEDGPNCGQVRREGAADESVISVGSIGHPRCCSRPCKDECDGNRCKEGKLCLRCHLCQWPARQG